MKVIIILIMFFRSLAAPPSDAVAIFESESINPFENLFKAVCQVESSGNQFAIGDNGKSYGISQIQQSRLDDYFNRTGIRYTLQDMFDVQKSRQIFMFYAQLHGPYQAEALCREWNSGPRWRQIKATKVYYRKIQAHLKPTETI